MKFIAPIRPFQETLAKVTAVIPSKSTLSQLETVLVELKGNIRVFFRMRPKLGKESASNEGDDATVLDVPSDEIVAIRNEANDVFKTYEFDRCFGGDTTQGALNICITVFGEAPPGQAILRSGALCV